MKDILDKNKGFSGEYEFLSNFYPCRIVYNGITYPSVEHAYQAAKTNDITERKRIACCIQAGTAKMIGKTVVLRDDWEEIKFSVMLSLVAQKFYKHKHLREKLISTKGIKLVEYNYWKDTYWGVCNGKGKNNLGKILMWIRDKLE